MFVNSLQIVGKRRNWNEKNSFYLLLSFFLYFIFFSILFYFDFILFYFVFPFIFWLVTARIIACNNTQWKGATMDKDENNNNKLIWESNKDKKKQKSSCIICIIKYRENHSNPADNARGAEGTERMTKCHRCRWALIWWHSICYFYFMSETKRKNILQLILYGK